MMKTTKLIGPMLLQVLSRDSVTVSVDAVVYYRVSNPTMATNNIEDYRYINNNSNNNFDKNIKLFWIIRKTMPTHKNLE